MPVKCKSGHTHGSIIAAGACDADRPGACDVDRPRDPADSRTHRVHSTGGPPVGDENSPFTFEGLAVLLEHLAEIQGNLPLDWRQWERRRLHGWARWVGAMDTKDPPRLALALTTADAPVAPEPPPLHAESALRTAPDAAWRSAWRAGWVSGWVAGRENGRTRPGLQPDPASQREPDR